MSITFIRFATHARSWLLIAALTALLVGLRAFLCLFAALADALETSSTPRRRCR
jgi:hypothetical protein